MTELNLRYFKKNPFAKDPYMATRGSAGADVSACLRGAGKVKRLDPYNRESLIPVSEHESESAFIRLHPAYTYFIPTGLEFDIPDNHLLKLYVRSSIGIKKGLKLANQVGIIDSDYTDELMVVIHNSSDNIQIVTHGDRISQFVLQETIAYNLTELSSKPASKHDRVGGIGSTGA